MMQDQISFSSLQLTVGGSLPSEEFLQDSFSEEATMFNHEGTFNSIERSIIDNRFYWFYSNFGKVMPRREIIFETETGEELENKRTKGQVEPSGQVFAMYDMQTSVFYISNMKKKAFFIEFFKQFTDFEVVIKNHYKNIEEFLEIIDSVESIKFTGMRDLLSTGGDLMEPLKNIFGYGEPVEFSIEAKYGLKIKEKIKRRILSLAKKQSSGCLKSLVCIGKDDKGFDQIFNTGSFIKKIDIFLDRDVQSLFLQKQVQSEIINKLKGMRKDV